VTRPGTAAEGTILSAADDLPVHQIAEPVAVAGTTDRHFYDRYYFCAHHCDDSVAVVAGLGQYPNLGVTDAFLSVTQEGHQEVLRSSRPLDADRLDLRVGPIAVEVLDGLRCLRVKVEPNDMGIEADLIWDHASAAYLEPRHLNRTGPRVTTNSVRFCQTGHWSGHLAIDGRRLTLDDDSWLGVRDRSWGIRPVGEPEPPGRRFADGPAGFLWLYSVLQFPDHVLVAILQEDAIGRRSLDHAARIFPDGTVEDLGSVIHELEFAPKTREVTAGRLRFGDAGDARARPAVLDIRPMTASYLALGTGYGTEPDWRHGMYQGPSATQRRSFDLADEATRRRSYGLIDSIASAEIGDERAFGLFEYAVLGRNERYGFAGRTRRDGSVGE
jgi:hypothetical protein